MSTSTSAYAVLRAGSPQLDYMCFVAVTVMDAYGAKGSSFKEVRVSPYLAPEDSSMADEAETLLAIASQGGGSSGSSAATQLVAAFASSLNDESSQQSVEAASATRNILSASLLSTVSLLATAPSNEDEGASDPSIEIPQEVMEMVGSGLAAVTAKRGALSAKRSFSSNY